MPILGKSLYEYFTEKFDSNLNGNESREETFKKTIIQIGFDAYSTHQSYTAARRRIRREDGKK